MEHVSGLFGNIIHCVNGSESIKTTGNDPSTSSGWKLGFALNFDPILFLFK